MSKGNVLFLISGSIACFKSAMVLSRLAQDGYDIETVLTDNALNFIGPATIEGLTSRAPHISTFAPGSQMSHIRLMRWADIIVLCPASANTISKLANGIADDLVSTLFLAHDFKKPFLIFPAMNTKMIEHPATQASLAKLKSWGLDVLDGDSGSLACGEIGAGRLLEPDKIVQKIEQKLAGSPVLSSRKKVLVTSGGTQEPIDGVRSIGNFSTGRTGAALAEALVQNGYRVTLLRAENSLAPQTRSPLLNEKTFVTFADLQTALEEQLACDSYDSIFHLAAVSDYSVANVSVDGQNVPLNTNGKLSSQNDLTIRLSPNPKLVDSIRASSKNSNVKLVAFKLTNGASVAESKQAIERLAKSSRAQFIVHNDLTAIDSLKHRAQVFHMDEASGARSIAELETKKELIEALVHLVDFDTVKVRSNAREEVHP